MSEQACWIVALVDQVERVLSARQGLAVGAVEAPTQEMREHVKGWFQAFGETWEFELKGPLHKKLEALP